MADKAPSVKSWFGTVTRPPAKAAASAPRKSKSAKHPRAAKPTAPIRNVALLFPGGGGSGKSKGVPSVAVLFPGAGGGKGAQRRAVNEYKAWMADTATNPTTPDLYSNAGLKSIQRHRNSDPPIGRFLKEFGGRALDATTVPGAAFQTAIAKGLYGLERHTGDTSALDTAKKFGGRAVDSIPGTNTAGVMLKGAKYLLSHGGKREPRRDISWQNAKGSFYHDAQGRSGSENAAAALTGTSNPWVNLGTQIVLDPLNLVGGATIPLKAGRAGSAARVAGKFDEVAEAVKDARKMTGGHQIPEVAKAIKKAQRSGHATPELKKLTATERHGAARVLLLRDAEEVARVKAAEKAAKAEKAARKKAGGKKVKPAVPPLEKANITPMAAPFANAHPQEITRRGIPLALSKNMDEVRRFHTARVIEPRDVVLTVAGKKIRIPGVVANKSPMTRSANPATGLLRMTPTQKIAHAIKRAGNDTAGFAPQSTAMLADAYGLAVRSGKDGKVLRPDPLAGTLIEIVGELGQQAGPEAAAALERNLTAAGLWTKGHRAALDEGQQAYRQFRPQDLTQDENIAYQRLLDKVDAATNTVAKERALDKVHTFEQNVQGNYMATGNAQKFAPSVKAGKRAKAAIALEQHPELYRHELDHARKVAKSSKWPSTFARVTGKELQQHLTSLGVPDQTARLIRSVVAQHLAAAGRRGFRRKPMNNAKRLAEGKKELPLPEWNFFTLLTERQRAHAMAQVDIQIRELAAEAATLGGGNAKQIFKELKVSVNPRGIGRAMNVKWVNAYLTGFIPGLKTWYTTVNAPHYTNNAVGDAIFNANTNGNWRHILGIQNTLPGTRADKLAKAGLKSTKDARGWSVELSQKDMDALSKDWKISKNRTMTGLEIEMATRLVGIGRGFHASDIADGAKMMSENKDVIMKMVMKWPHKGVELNARRDAAQRISTFVKHMQGGDDMFTAAEKTIRVHFDYSELTDFERIVMRNTMLFYVWFKKNPILQASTLATRPGYQAAFAKMNDAREEYPNEPEYYKEQGAFRVPGIGNVRVPGDPRTGLYMFDLNGDALRRNLIGAMTPHFKIAAEGPMNLNTFTGAPIHSYDDELTPQWTASLLRTLGVPDADGMLGRTRTGGQGGPVKSGINPWVAWIVGNAQGPMGSQIQALYTDSGKTVKPSWVDYLARAVGAPQRQRNNPDVFNAIRAINDRKTAEGRRRKTRAQGGLN